MTECFGTGSKKVRGRAQRSTDLIEAMYEIAEASQPITGRGVGYKLFTEGKIPSMSRPNMQRVYRLLKEAREEGIIPWHWIVDENSRARDLGDMEKSRGIRRANGGLLPSRFLGPAARARPNLE